MDQANPTQSSDTQPQVERRQADEDGSGRRQSVVDRRSGVDRRDMGSLKRLRGPGRRRPEFNRAAEEGEFTDEQFLFVMAINEFKKANQKSFPTWTEVLEVMRKLGYRKTQPMCIELKNATDWTEPADAPAMPPEPDDTVEE